MTCTYWINRIALTNNPGLEEPNRWRFAVLAYRTEDRQDSPISRFLRFTRGSWIGLLSIIRVGFKPISIITELLRYPNFQEFYMPVSRQHLHTSKLWRSSTFSVYSVKGRRQDWTRPLLYLLWRLTIGRFGYLNLTAIPQFVESLFKESMKPACLVKKGKILTRRRSGLRHFNNTMIVGDCAAWWNGA